MTLGLLCVVFMLFVVVCSWQRSRPNYTHRKCTKDTKTTNNNIRRSFRSFWAN